MNQHAREAALFQRLQPVPHRGVARCATGDGFHGQVFVFGVVVGMHDHKGVIDLRMTLKNRQCPVGNAASRKGAPLLGRACASTGSAACGNDNGRRFLMRFIHRVCLSPALQRRNRPLLLG